MGLYQYQLHVPTCCFFTFDAPSLPNTSLRTVANIKKLSCRHRSDDRKECFCMLNNNVYERYLYSSHDFMSMSSSLTLQKACMKELARRLFVISGTLRSIAARRIL